MKQATKRKRTPVVCPYCGSTDIARYVYGLVDLHDDMLFNSKIALGGCIIEEDVSPKYQCNNCEKDFGIYMRSKKNKPKDSKS